jgi:plastocyanin
LKVFLNIERLLKGILGGVKMKTNLILLSVVFVLSLGIILTGCTQQNQPVNTGQTGQNQQPATPGEQPPAQTEANTTPPPQTNPPPQTQPAPSPTPQPSPSPQQPKTIDVTIQGFAFSPFDLKINKGDTVIWTNKDSASHTVTSDSGSELASGTLATGQTYSHTFNEAGTFNYHCGIHLTMKARVEVS